MDLNSIINTDTAVSTFTLLDPEGDVCIGKMQILPPELQEVSLENLQGFLSQATVNGDIHVDYRFTGYHLVDFRFGKQPKRKKGQDFNGLGTGSYIPLDVEERLFGGSAEQLINHIKLCLEKGSLIPYEEKESPINSYTDYLDL